MSLMGFNSNVSALANTSASMTSQIMPWLQQWQAALSQQYQNTIGSISGGNNNSNYNIKPIDPTKPADPAKTTVTADDLDDKKMKETLEKIKKTIGDDTYNKLKALLDDPTKLSEENYTKIQEIFAKFINGGRLFSTDIDALKAIIKDPTKTTVVEETKTDKNTSLSLIKQIDTNQATPLADDFKEAIYGSGTNSELMNRDARKIEANNVIEVMKKFEDEYGVDHNETLIDAIANDCERWDDEGDSWWQKNVWGSENAKTSVALIQEALKKRAQGVIDKFKAEHSNDEFYKELETAITNCSLNERKQGLESTKNLYKVLSKAEDALKDKGKFRDIDEIQAQNIYTANSAKV
jgi:hypothetical protein